MLSAPQPISSFNPCRSLVNCVSSVITKDRCYTVAWGVAAIAFTAFSFYAPVTFFVGSLVLSTLNAVYFSKKANEGNASSQTLKTWMIVSCFVMSAVLGAGLLRCFPLLKSAYNSIRCLKMENFFLDLFLINGVVGCMGPLMQATYQRGLELLNTAQWVQMDSYLSDSATPVRDRVNGVFSRLSFFRTVITPTSVSPRSWIGSSSVAFFFLSTSQKKELLKEKISDFRIVSPHIAELDRTIKMNNILVHLMMLSQELLEDEHQSYLIQLLNIAHGNASLETPIVPFINSLTKVGEKLYLPLSAMSAEGRQDLSPSIWGEVVKFHSRKTEEVQEEYRALLYDFEAQHTGLNARIESQRKEKNERELESISSDLSGLREQATKLMSLITSLGNDQKEISEQISILRTWLIKLDAVATKLIDVKGRQEEIDLTDTPWNYFLMNAPAFSTASRSFTGFFDYFKQIFGTEDADVIDKNLSDLEIGTMGDFITRVLNGRDTLLKGSNAKEREENITEIRRLLDTYIASRRTPDSRNSIYEGLAGRIKKDGSKWVDLASRVAYRAIMILTSIAPMIVYPWHALTAFSISLVCNSIPCLRERIAYCADSILGVHGRGSVGVVQLAIYGYRFAETRPFLSLFSRQNPPRAMQTYERAGLFGRMRILSLESLYGFMLLAVNPEGIEEFGTGGLVQGLALGTEMHGYASRAWRRIRPQAGRRLATA